MLLEDRYVTKELISLSPLSLHAATIMQHDNPSRLNGTLDRYKSLIKGYELSGITDLYHENERINYEKKVSCITNQNVYHCLLDFCVMLIKFCPESSNHIVLKTIAICRSNWYTKINNRDSQNRFQQRSLCGGYRTQNTGVTC